MLSGSRVISEEFVHSMCFSVSSSSHYDAKYDFGVCFGPAPHLLERVDS